MIRPFLLSEELLHQSRQALNRNVQSSLSTNHEVHKLHESLAFAFNDVNVELPWLTPFQLTVERTQDHIASYYWDINRHSAYTVAIRQGNRLAPIWREDDGWSLNDEYFSVDQISASLSNWPSLVYPRNVKAIKEHLDSGNWAFDLKCIPVLDSKPPADLVEVISWDAKNILVGTTLKNLAVLTREEWSRMGNRERWFEN